MVLIYLTTSPPSGGDRQSVSSLTDEGTEAWGREMAHLGHHMAGAEGELGVFWFGLTSVPCASVPLFV